MQENFYNKYTKIAVPALKQQFGYKNNLAVPRVKKIVVSAGIGAGLKDPKFSETVVATLQRVTGQKPVLTLAKKSISGFKIRQGQAVGAMVTLRGKRMYDFLEKLINITLPRVRDFRGLAVQAIDQKGNLNIGFREHNVFPEIRPDEVEKLHGLQITIATTAASREIGLVLLKLLGFPFREKEITTK